MNVQSKLLKHGVKGYFLPDAVVSHYVPPERCSPEWTLLQKRKNGVGKGIAYAEDDMLTRWKQQIGCRAKLAGYAVAMAVGRRWMSEISAFHCHCRIQWLQGKLEGMKRVALERVAKLENCHGGSAQS